MLNWTKKDWGWECELDIFKFAIESDMLGDDVAYKVTIYIETTLVKTWRLDCPEDEILGWAKYGINQFFARMESSSRCNTCDGELL